MAHAKSFVLIHGAWHDHHAWDFVAPLLEEAGHNVMALDLPGSGVYAKYPSSYLQRPFDLEAFKTEPSPNADVTQKDRNEAAIAAVLRSNVVSGTKAILVGHSLGGLTVSGVGEAIPEELSAVVYISAFLLPPGICANQILADKCMNGRVTSKLYIGDPSQIGAVRINPKTEDPLYRSLIKKAYYGDVGEDRVRLAVSYLSSDEPLGVLTAPSSITAARFGHIPRHYIHSLQDRAVPIAAQREMVRLVDDAMQSQTCVHTLDSSHSPFFSYPEALSNLLKKIAES